MSNRCFFMISFIITLILITILLTFASSTSASSNWDYIETPNEVMARLISMTIDAYNPNLSENQKSTICEAIITEATETDFDPLLISSVIAAESSFVPKAVSRCSAQGLMQLTDCVVQIMHIKNPFDIHENIYGGTRYLKDLRQLFKDTELTLAAYNAGPTRVARLKRVPRIQETIYYVQKVQRFYAVLQNKYRIAMLNSMIQPVCFKPDSPSNHKLLKIKLYCQVNGLPGSPEIQTIDTDILLETRSQRMESNLCQCSRNNLQYS